MVSVMQASSQQKGSGDLSPDDAQGGIELRVISQINIAWEESYQ